MQEILAKLNEMDERYEKRFAAIDARFDKQDERFAKQDERFAKQDERFAKQDERFAKQDERFAKQDKRFDEHEARFDRQMKRIEKRFSDHDKQFAETKQRLTQIERTLSLLTEKVISHDERLERIENTMVTRADHNVLLNRMDEMLVILKKRDLEMVAVAHNQSILADKHYLLEKRVSLIEEKI